MKITDNVYNILKGLAQYVLPALATLYFTLAAIWQFPYPDEIVGSIMALDALLGLVVGLTERSYDMTNRQDPEWRPAPKLIDNPTMELRKVGIFITMTGAQYDMGITIVQYVLPGIGTFVFALSGIWGFSGDQIVGTIAALDTFLAVILGISHAQYKIGVIEHNVMKESNSMNDCSDSLPDIGK